MADTYCQPFLCYINIMIEAVIFDLDGTLLYTLEDLKNSTNFALREFGYPERTLEEVRQFVGNGVRKLIERAVPDGTDTGITEEVLRVFKENYGQNMYNCTKPYNSIEKLLLELKQNGLKTAVVSNKFDLAVKELCKKYFGDLIDVAIGQRDDVPKKPAPDGVLTAIEELGVKRENCIYVGDSDVDVLTAKNSGLPCIGVTWGYRDRELLESKGADYIVNDPLKILDLIKALNR